MQYRPLGRSGLFVSALALGTMTWGGANAFWRNIGGTNAEGAARQLRAAFDAGVNLVDTADVYSFGAAEELLGCALRETGIPRHDILVASKARLRMGPGANRVGLSRTHLMAALDASLERLGLDHLDIWQIHGPDPLTPIEETLRAMEDAVRSGRVRHIGACNQPAWQMSDALAVSDRRGWSRFESNQVYYSLAGRDAEREIVPQAIAHGIGLLVWSPLAGGYLSGKYRAGSNGGRRLAFDFPPVDPGRGARVLAALEAVAVARGATMARIALAWTLARPAVASVILGARTEAQLADNLAAADLVLTPQETDALNAASDLPAEFPGWHLARLGGDRAPGAASAQAERP